MTLSPQDSKRLAHLFRMASVAQDFPTVDLKLNTFWDAMREDLGLAKFLLLLQEYCEKPKTLNDIAVEMSNIINEPKGKDIIYP